MSARDDVLAAVRAALADGPTLPEVPRGHREGGPPVRAALLDLFTERVADYRAIVRRCSAAELEGVLAEVTSGCGPVVVPDGLPWSLPDATMDEALSAAELDEVGSVVTAAAVAVADTGTIVLDHGPGQGRRVLSLVPDRHVCVVRADQVVAGVPQAVARLDPHRPQTWISGPSATSDIELSRVEGVHGPRQLVVLLVEG